MLFLSGVGLLISSCSSIAPPSIPAQLDNTPGAFVRVTDRYYENDIFRVNSPDGWRVQTSPATSAPYVLFIAPDNIALMIFATETLDPLPQPNINPERLSSDIRTITLDNGVDVFTALIAPTNDFDESLTLYEIILATLTATE
ncbi:MAG: hypothetical protein RLP44_18615 [Aggregatilineales bacterium]